MKGQSEKFKKFVRLVQAHCQEEGANYASIEGFGAYKASSIQEQKPAVDLPAVWIIAQGTKVCHAGEERYDYKAGQVVVLFYPMAVETEILEASAEKPFLVAGAFLEMSRLADMSLRIDRIDGAAAKPLAADPSGIFSIPLQDDLLNPFIRLFELLDNPRDAAILGEAAFDEIYYRLLTGERGGELRFLLQQRGQIQRISRAVEHIHANLDQPVSVQELAGMVHMSRTSFYENFREVMHVSPLQYAKSLKLHRAQKLIQEGHNASEAGHKVGYNSPAHFSRKYKRHFGYAPSATLSRIGAIAA